MSAQLDPCAMVQVGSFENIESIELSAAVSSEPMGMPYCIIDIDFGGLWAQSVKRTWAHRSL
ncbi:hypothetical protein PDE_08275 [Penicillium oxalicum 114-2]|uniref:Uncharacterized protein n=1 Tax=Penicillium oxalicum (strain 114-2 / CGMCC 5302) TaxID=933388 RepID=S8B3A1_PENO1|nr:hypothetical protein PDE_08275 [Penicillium oxalicum 114-2]